MNDLDQFKAATQAFFRKGDWKDEDKEMKQLAEAATWDDLYYAIYCFAESIGDRKGYGEEGKGSLQTEFIEEIEKESTLKFNYDAL